MAFGPPLWVRKILELILPDTLLTYAECISFIPNLGNEPQATVSAYIEAASRSVESYCNREFLSKTVTERYVINQSQRIYLKRTPVTSVSRIALYQQADPVKADSCGYVSSFNSAQTNLTETKVAISLEYTLEPGTGVLTLVNPYINRFKPLIRQDNPWGQQYFYQVDYTGGYDAVPSQIKLAIAQLVNGMYAAAKYDNALLSERIGDYSYTRASFDAFLSAKNPVAHLLSPYTRYSVNGI